MTTEYFVIGNAPGDSWVLTLEGGTIESGARAIAWQRVGQGQFDPPAYWAVAAFDPERGAFVTLDGRELRPGIGPYTAKAWNNFCERVGYRPDPRGDGDRQDGPDWAPETRHERDCAYVTANGPAPCTCRAGRAQERQA